MNHVHTFYNNREIRIITPMWHNYLALSTVQLLQFMQLSRMEHIPI